MKTENITLLVVREDTILSAHRTLATAAREKKRRRAELVYVGSPKWKNGFTTTVTVPGTAERLDIRCFDTIESWRSAVRS